MSARPNRIVGMWGDVCAFESFWSWKPRLMQMLPVIERVGPRKVGSWDVSGVEDIVWFVCIIVFGGWLCLYTVVH